MMTPYVRPLLAMLAFLIIASAYCPRALADSIAFSRSDPAPVYTSKYPQFFLYRQQKEKMKGLPYEDIPERINFAISPFAQNADSAKNAICPPLTPPACNVQSSGITTKPVEIGDLCGRWDMITTLFGPLPTGKTLPPVLETALTNIFGVAPGTLNDESIIDPTEKFGFFTIPVKYRKRGVRFQLDMRPLDDIGLALKIGCADICQQRLFVNLTDTGTAPTSSYPNLTTANVDKYLMREIDTIAEQIGLNIECFNAFSIEDIRAELYWRHAYLINGNNPGYAQFLIEPFLILEGSVATGKDISPSKAFGVSFGNNGHNSIGGTAGLNLDFTDTIEIGAKAGLTHFFSRRICNYRVPNSELQSGIFPFTADVCYSPGFNWHFGASMAAYHFLERLSFWLECVLVGHERDCIQLLTPDPAFSVKALEDRCSCMRSYFVDVGFNYDISPNLALGFFWQTPIKQTNAYRSTTVMFSFNATY